MSKENMTVYLVTYGSYGDYRVEAAFSSREKARPYVDYLTAKGETDAEIEELELDSKEPKPLRTIHRFEFNKWNGSIGGRSEIIDADQPDEVDSGDSCVSYISLEDAQKKAAKLRSDFLLANPSHVWASVAYFATLNRLAAPNGCALNHDLMTC